MQATPTSKLLDWYDAHRRALPWRALPGAVANPYHVWLSEIMLQQTTVATVIGYFEKFIDIWPTVHDLAAAEDDAVMTAWAGLGYYARARNLLKCARLIVDQHAGHFPDTEDALRALPGVGPYTAAAIAAIAFNQPAAPVDGNIERVLSRLAADTTPLPKLKARIKAYNASLVPAERPGDFAQAMMDLGSSLCTPKRPACGDCPWQADCAAHAGGVAETLPRKAPKREKPERRGTVYWLENKAGDVWMARRPEKGLLGGMYMFPSQGWDPANDAPLDTLAPGTWTPLSGEVVHVFTHFRLTLTVEARTWPHDDPPPIEGRWVAPHDFANVALPSVMVKVAKHVLS